MAEVARRLNIPHEEIFAAGDHWNDLPMLQSDLAQWLVAPANAISEVMEHVRSQGGFVAKGESGEGVLEGIEWALATEVF
jgi:hydroxymethylpyrimidine pyrophosphatase-like HAD family hydrolase